MSYHKYCLESRSVSEEEAMTTRANICFQVWKWSHHRDEALLQEEGCLNNRRQPQSSEQYRHGILNIWEGETLSESLLNLPYALSDPLNPAWSMFS